MRRDAEALQFFFAEAVAILVRDEYNFILGALGVHYVFIPDAFGPALLPQLDPNSALHSH